MEANQVDQLLMIYGSKLHSMSADSQRQIDEDGL